MKEFINTWYINNRINLYLLEAIHADQLSDVSSSKGRNVGEQFAHLHNVRLLWLKVAAPDLMEGLIKLDKESRPDKKMIARELKKSSDAIAKLLEKGFKDGKIKGFKPDAAAFFGYMLAHDAHHRGQIMLALKQSGHAVDQKVQYGLWEWGVR